MNWIRISVKIKGDPRIGAIARACKVRIHEAVGFVTCCLLEFPEHAPDGQIADVDDLMLEHWALWPGEPGVFAQAFRTHMCDTEQPNVVRAWEKINGAAIRKAEADIARKRSARLAPRAESAPERRADGARQPSGRRTDGARTARVDVDGDDTPTTTPAAAAVAVGGAPGAEQPAAASAYREPEALPDEYHRERDVIRAQFTDVRHSRAFDQHLRASGNPFGLVMDLRAASRRRPSDGAEGVPWDVLGQVLHDMTIKMVRPTEHNLRAFARIEMAPKSEASGPALQGEQLFAAVAAADAADPLSRLGL